MNKAVILVVLPCLIALVASQAYSYLPNYGYQQAYLPPPRVVAPYQNYAQNSYNAVKQARLFNYRKFIMISLCICNKKKPNNLFIKVFIKSQIKTMLNILVSYNVLLHYT